MSARLTLAAALAIFGCVGAGASPAFAAGVFGDAAISPVGTADTVTPTFVFKLDVSTQADGAPTSANPYVEVDGRDPLTGKFGPVAVCNATQITSDGQFSCSDPQHPLQNGGLYVWVYHFNYHTCIQINVPGLPPTYPRCNFLVAVGEATPFQVRLIPDFTITAPPTVATVQGGTGQLDATITARNGFNSTIIVAATGMPPGVTPSYQGAAGVMHIQFSVAPTTTPGDFPITITGTGGGLTHSVSTTLHVAQLPLPTALVRPTVLGVTRTGSVLRATPGTWDGAGLTYAYQWSRCSASGGSCTAISGATAATYKLGSADLGRDIEVAVTATDPGGTASSSSSAIGPVKAALKPKPTAARNAKKRKSKRGQRLLLSRGERFSKPQALSDCAANSLIPADV